MECLWCFPFLQETPSSPYILVSSPSWTAPLYILPIYGGAGGMMRPGITWLSMWLCDLELISIFSGCPALLPEAEHINQVNQPSVVTEPSCLWAAFGVLWAVVILLKIWLKMRQHENNIKGMAPEWTVLSVSVWTKFDYKFIVKCLAIFLFFALWIWLITFLLISKPLFY
jgi:hypothetical protein